MHSSLIQLTQTALLEVFPQWSIAFNDQLLMIFWIFLHDLVQILMERGLSYSAVVLASVQDIIGNFHSSADVGNLDNLP